MKTIRDTEDIDIENNEIHKTLYSAATINIIIASVGMAGLKSMGEEERTNRASEIILQHVAQILDSLDDAGLLIVKNEIPAAFQ